MIRKGNSSIRRKEPLWSVDLLFEENLIQARISQCDKCWPSVEEWEANRSPAKTPMEGPDLLSQLEEREAHVK